MYSNQGNDKMSVNVAFIHSNKIMHIWQFCTEIIIKSFQWEDKTQSLSCQFLSFQSTWLWQQLAVFTNCEHENMQWAEHVLTPHTKNHRHNKPTCNKVGKAWIQFKFSMSSLNRSVICKPFSHQNLNSESNFMSLYLSSEWIWAWKNVFFCSSAFVGEE